MSWLPERMKTIRVKMKALECSQLFSHCKSIGIFFKTLKGSQNRSPKSILAETQTHLSFNGCPPYLQDEKDPIKNESAIVVTTL